MSFNPLKRINAADQVARTIRDAILSGRLTPGDSLPSERSLAGQFEVNRSTVREALKRLDSWGLVQTRHGGSTKVRDFLVSAGLSLLPHLIAPGGEVDSELVSDLLSLRSVLLSFSGKLATENATEEELNGLEELVVAMDEATDSRELQALDWRFFQQLVTLGGNRVLVLLVGPLGEVYSQNQGLFEAIYSVNTFQTVHHHQWLAAARAGDVHAASEAMLAYGESVLGGRS